MALEGDDNVAPPRVEHKDCARDAAVTDGDEDERAREAPAAMSDHARERLGVMGARSHARRFSTPPPRRLVRQDGGDDARFGRGDSLRDMRATHVSPDVVAVQLNEAHLNELLQENGGPSDVLRRLARAGTVISPLPMRLSVQRRESEELSVAEPEEAPAAAVRGDLFGTFVEETEEKEAEEDSEDSDDDSDDDEDWSVVNRLALQHRIKPVAVSVPGESTAQHRADQRRSAEVMALEAAGEHEAAMLLAHEGDAVAARADAADAAGTATDTAEEAAAAGGEERADAAAKRTAALPPPAALKRPPSARVPSKAEERTDTPDDTTATATPDDTTATATPEDATPEDATPEDTTTTPEDTTTATATPEDTTATATPDDDGVVMRTNLSRRAEILKARRGVRLDSSSAADAALLGGRGGGRSSSAQMEKPPPAALIRQRSRTSVTNEPDEQQRNIQDKISAMFDEEHSKKRKPSKVFVKRLAELDGSVPSKQGYLTKQGGKVKSWKCRWFVLKNQILFYYENPDAITKNKALGAIPLVGTTVERCFNKKIKKEFCFTVSTLQRRYFIHAESEEEMQEWMAAIRAKANGSLWDMPQAQRMEGTVRCHIIEAKDVCAKDVTGTSDPFCILLLDGAQCRTDTKPKTLTPVWNEEFEFDSVYSSSCLYITVWDDNQFSKPVFMGQCAVAMIDVIEQKRVNTWLSLRARGKKERVGGALHVELEYMSMGSDELLPGVPKVFGRPLEELLAQEERAVPRFVDEAVSYLRRNALDLEGLFRVPGRAFEIKLLKKSVDLGDYSWMRSCDDSHIIGGLLKLYFRELPEPLLGFDLYEDFLAVPQTTQDETIRMAFYTTLIARLSPQRRHLLFYLLDFLNTVAEHADKNKMTGGNLAIVFGPNLLRPRVESSDTLFQVMETSAICSQLIRQYRTIRDRLESAAASPLPP